MSSRSSEWLEEAKIISEIISNSTSIDKNVRIEPEEFKEEIQILQLSLLLVSLVKMDSIFLQAWKVDMLLNN